MLYSNNCDEKTPAAVALDAVMENWHHDYIGDNLVMYAVGLT